MALLGKAYLPTFIALAVLVVLIVLGLWALTH